MAAPHDRAGPGGRRRDRTRTRRANRALSRVRDKRRRAQDRHPPKPAVRALPPPPGAAGSLQGSPSTPRAPAVSARPGRACALSRKRLPAVVRSRSSDQDAPARCRSRRRRARSARREVVRRALPGRLARLASIWPRAASTSFLENSTAANRWLSIGSPGCRRKPCSQSFWASSGRPALNAVVAWRTMSSAACWVMAAH